MRNLGLLFFLKKKGGFFPFFFLFHSNINIISNLLLTISKILAIAQL